MLLSGIFRAWGGFEVSASLKDGEIEKVTVLSHKGNTCRVENPWPEKSVIVKYGYSGREEVCFGEYLSIELQKEEQVLLFVL